MVEPATAQPAAVLTTAEVFSLVVYSPLHDVQQWWINQSIIGPIVDNYLINPIPRLLFGVDLIGNGAPGAYGLSLAEAAGHPGGLLFGAGGPGGTGTGGPGSNGIGGRGGHGGIGGNGTGIGKTGGNAGPGGPGGDGVGGIGTLGDWGYNGINAH